VNDFDYSKDEFQRAMRAADEANRAAMPAFREALRRHLSRDSRDRLPADGRRAFLRATGLVVVGGAAFVACGSDEPAPGAAETGEPPTTAGASTTTAGASTTTTGGEGGPTADDVGLATAAIQIENTAVAAYTAVAALRTDLPAPVAAAATLFADHHAQHAAALNALLRENGADEVPEDQLFDGITLPDEATIRSADLPTLGGVARGLENQAAQTYVTAVPLLSVPILRQAIMGIGGAEARHVTTWDVLLAGGVTGYDAELVQGGNYPTSDSFL
jgi:hypothetical protein